MKKLTFILLLLTSIKLYSADPSKVIVKDPIFVGKAWSYQDSDLQFNDRYEKGGKWQTRFSKNIFNKLTSEKLSKPEIKRLVPSESVQGKVSLLVENNGGTYVFETGDFGENWNLVKAPEKPKAKTVASKPVKEEAVDLTAMTNTSHHGAPPQASSAPVFKILFDLLLHLRPGISSWTFDNYHSLFLVDFIPKPEIQFSFEVNPTPRYYEFDYQISKAWQLRLGRIWIPFDDMSPHNTFGGLVNTSKVRDPRAAAFLPDIWADLGVGAKWRFTETSQLQGDLHFYVVNGFQTGGTDPTGATTAYPNFAGSTGIDNNTDKALGTRVHFTFNQMFGLGASVYTARYTDQADEAKRLTLLGLDGSIRLLSGTTLKAGYTYQKVELPSTSAKTDYLRGGAYIDATHRFPQKYMVGGRFGVQQSDDRITDLNDQTWITGRVGYETDIWQLYLIYAKDINDTPDKSYRDYTAARFVVTM